jgi:hypothetical protein
MHDNDLHATLAGVIRDAFFDARNAGETMYQASDVAATNVISLLAPTLLRLQHEMDTLVAKWEQDRKTYPSDDWQARLADTLLKLCIQELRAAMYAANPTERPMEVGQA